VTNGVLLRFVEVRMCHQHNNSPAQGTFIEMMVLFLHRPPKTLNIAKPVNVVWNGKIFVYYKQKTSRVSRKFHESMTVLKIKCKNSSYRNKILFIQHPRFTEFTFMKLFAANRETFGPKWAGKVSWNGRTSCWAFSWNFCFTLCTQYVQ
jgi:hypothetical protein